MSNQNQPTQYKTIIYSGKVEQVYAIHTAINKKRITGDVYLSELGLAGDECANPKFHGGVERALHHYPREHYQYWSNYYAGQSQELTQFSQRSDVNEIAGMGENISTLGLCEENVHIGDRFQWGEAIIEVSQPRSPCMSLNKRWALHDISVQMQKLSLCGWLYRVIQTGIVNQSDELMLIDRPALSLSIKQVCDIYFADPLNQQGIQKLLSIEALSQSWRSKLEQRLLTGEVENWNFRLLGHA
jgi:MOSC domain-containing protein YiiM